MGDSAKAKSERLQRDIKHQSHSTIMNHAGGEQRKVVIMDYPMNHAGGTEKSGKNGLPDESCWGDREKW